MTNYKYLVTFKIADKVPQEKNMASAEITLTEVESRPTKTIDLGEFEISFISTIFGAMSAKVNTIIDFFFGGSSSKNEQTK